MSGTDVSKHVHSGTEHVHAWGTFPHRHTQDPCEREECRNLEYHKHHRDVNRDFLTSFLRRVQDQAYKKGKEDGNEEARAVA